MSVSGYVLGKPLAEISPVYLNENTASPQNLQPVSLTFIPLHLFNNFYFRTIFKDCCPFTVIIKDWLYSLCCVGLAKNFIQFSCRMMWKNMNKLFGHPNVLHLCSLSYTSHRPILLCPSPLLDIMSEPLFFFIYNIRRGLEF